jgi:hypothetical protein
MSLAPDPRPKAKPTPGAVPGSLFVPAFMDIVVHGDLPIQRQRIIEACYKELLSNHGKARHSGQAAGPSVLTLNDILDGTDLSGNPAFKPHEKGSMRVLRKSFYESWGDHRQASDVISLDEFINFYSDFSPIIPSDSEFARIMKSMHNLGTT